MKKFLSLLCAIALIVTLALGLTACNSSEKSGGIAKVEAKDVYALSALSGAKLLVANSGDPVDFTFETGTDESDKVLPTPIDGSDEKEIEDCLLMFGDVISGGGFTKTVEENLSSEGVESVYKYVMKITVPGDGEYSLYYNETATKTKTELDDGEEETETVTIIEGLLKIDGNEYLVSGKNEIETENGEREEKIEITTKSKDNPLDYVVITYSVEDEKGEKETSFEYEYYENGKKVGEKEISFEEKNGRTELKIERKNKADNTETEYKIVSENGQMVVIYEENGVKSRVYVKQNDAQ